MENFMAEGILLESGTNELELLEFTINGNYYGINVAKVKEILPYTKPTVIPNAHRCIEGVFMPRDSIITAVDLARVLNMPPSGSEQYDMYVVTAFNKLSVAFHVHTVNGIHRISWNDINKPDDTLGDESCIATGIVRIDGKLIVILDFEKIIFDISPITGLNKNEIAQLGVRERSTMPILMVEDSHLLSAQIHECLTQAGYSNVVAKQDGFQAWEYLTSLKENKMVGQCRCIITDIEMPRMDGHRLTKLVKDDNELKDIPVIIFSSLVNEDMRRKGESLGADAQLSKPEIGKLVAIVDSLIARK